MTCQEVIDYMHRQLDGDLDERETELLMNHTRNCPDCAEMLERLSRLSSELENLPKVTPSYSLVDAIMPRLEQIELERQQEQTAGTGVVLPAPSLNSEQPRRNASDRRSKGWLARYRLLGGIAAAGIVAGIFIFTYTPSMLPTAMENNAFSLQSAADSAPAAGADEPSTELTLNAKVFDQMDMESHSAQDGLDGTAPVESEEDREAASASGESNSPPAGAGSEQPTIIAHQDQSGSELEDSIKDNKLVTPSSSARDITAEHGNATSHPDAGNRSATPADNTKPLEESSDSASDSPPKADERGLPEAGVVDKAPDIAAVPKSEARSFTPSADMRTAQQEAVSPNGFYRAAVTGQFVEIYDAATSELLVRAGEKKGELSNLYWSEDNLTLSYDVRLEDGTLQHYVIQVKDGTEVKQEL